jgi:hypothetical protein
VPADAAWRGGAAPSGAVGPPARPRVSAGEVPPDWAPRYCDGFPPGWARDSGRDGQTGTAPPGCHVVPAGPGGPLAGGAIAGGPLAGGPLTGGVVDGGPLVGGVVYTGCAGWTSGGPSTSGACPAAAADGAAGSAASGVPIGRLGLP